MFSRTGSAVTVALLALAAPRGAQAFDISVYGLANLSTLSFNKAPPPTTSAGSFLASGGSVAWNTGFGGALILGQNFGPYIGLQYGGVVTARGYATAIGGQYTNFLYEDLLLPIELRINPIPQLSLHVGGYYSRALSSTIAETDSSGSTVTETLAQASLQQFDYGLCAGAALLTPLSPAVTLMLDVRFYVGFSNLDPTGATDLSARDGQILLGLKLGI